MAQPTETSGTASEATPAEGELKRGLSARHMQMIAIGGAIGTGLFVASGKTISTAGPGGAILAYALIGVMVLFLMQSLGEMAAHLPVPGAFQTYAARYVSPSFGFAMGWNYWFNWAVTVAADLVASGLVMAYWFPSVPSWIWAVGFLGVVVGLNALSARVYGEAEFWLAAIKVVIVIVFVLSGVLMIAGVMGQNSPGLSNWTTGDAPFHNGFVGVIAVFMIAAACYVAFLVGQTTRITEGGRRIPSVPPTAMVPVAIVGAWRQDRYGNLRRGDAAWIGVLSLAGAALGVVIANAVPERALEIGFACVLVLVAAQLARRALRPAG